MASVVEYITQNYGYFLFFIILVFLSVIGYFAEKTNNAKKAEEKSKNKDVEKVKESLNKESFQMENINNPEPMNSLADKTLINNEIVNNLQEEKVVKYEKEAIESEEVSEIEPLSEAVETVEIQEKQKSTENTDIFENDDFNQFSLEFDTLLPKKETIDYDLLNDIDSLELEKTQKINLNEIPVFDNIELPKIKQMEEEKDIW